MNKLLLILACLGAAYYFKPQWFGATGHASGTVGDASVVVFTHNNCGSYCEQALGALRQRNIAFEHYNIQQDKAGEEKWRKMGGGNNFPVTFIGKKQLQGYYPKQYESALVAAFGAQALDAGHKAIIESNMATYGDDTVVMYATSWCPYCAKARAFFKDNGINYVELDVEKSSSAKSDYENLDAGGYPLIYLGINRFDGFGPETKKDLKRLL